MALPRNENLHEEELNFLKEQLKKINVGIKTFQYGGSVSVVEAQTKLWELREKVMKEISDKEDRYKEDNET